MGRSGLRVSGIALATRGWGTQVDEPTAQELLERYRAAGGAMIETGHDYGDGAAEELVGALLATARRDELTLCTTSGLGVSGGSDPRADTSRGGLLRQLDISLSRLRTDYVDLWLVGSWNDAVPPAEAMSALEYAVQSGRARYVGVGGHRGWQLVVAATTLAQARIPLVACATAYNVLQRGAERELIDAARHLGTGLLAWSPLAAGVLAGKYRRGVPAQSRAASGPAVPMLHEGNGPVVEAVVTAAEGLGVSPTEVALAWVRDRPSVSTVAVGARTPTQLEQVLRSDELTIPREVVDALDEVSA